MTTQKNRYSVVEMGTWESLGNREYKGRQGKFFAGEDLGLTGCEISMNRLPAGTGAPFVHAHKKNEELYLVIGGTGTFFVDGDEFPIREGSMVRVAPAGERALQAGDQDLYYICIQAQEGSLTQATFDDGIRLETETSWIKK
ncbi:MAG TPA: cupin domain-containing protein [Patescibacteria group bacterium]|nr:cupin domain-containing protein [Patescibacteria group bacterium]